MSAASASTRPRRIICATAYAHPTVIFPRRPFPRRERIPAGHEFVFANHHAAHALAALFYTDWDDALVYTADGIGDNISYSIRALRDGRLDLYYGDDSLLRQPGALSHDSLATAYGYATKACGFRMWRHEGKLTGLSARGEPVLADALARHFDIGADGLIDGDFKSTRVMG